MEGATKTPIKADKLKFIIKSEILVFLSLISKINYYPTCSWLVDGIVTNSNLRLDGPVTACLVLKSNHKVWLRGSTKFVNDEYYLMKIIYIITNIFLFLIIYYANLIKMPQ